MRIYISGPITGNNSARRDFAHAERMLRRAGFKDVINPEAILHRLSLTHTQYLHICKSLVDVADVMLLLHGWRKSTGACMEVGFAMSKGIDIYELDENGEPRLLGI